jgi:hypothetical protein
VATVIVAGFSKLGVHSVAAYQLELTAAAPRDRPGGLKYRGGTTDTPGAQCPSGHNGSRHFFDDTSISKVAPVVQYRGFSEKDSTLG